MRSVELGDVTVEWLGHASVKLRNGDKTVYIDPWSEVIDLEDADKADIIVSTHDHFDHFDTEALQSLKKENTVVLCTEESVEKLPRDFRYEVLRSGEETRTDDTVFKGVPAYNIDKFRESGEPFHPEGFCAGVVFELDGMKFYHASDTDPIPEMEELADEDIDLAFMPIGGHYTMDQEEAIEAYNMVQPEKVVPVHYGTVEGTDADPERFKEEIEGNAVVLEHTES